MIENILLKNLCHINFVYFFAPKIQATVYKVVHK